MSSQSSFLGRDELPTIPPTSEEKTLALISHVITFVSSFIAPLIIYLVKKDESAFVRHHAKESLNFQITMFLLIVVLIISVIGLLLLWLVAIYVFIVVIVATIRASEGKLYYYPFSIKFIK